MFGDTNPSSIDVAPVKATNKKNVLNLTLQKGGSRERGKLLVGI